MKADEGNCQSAEKDGQRCEKKKEKHHQDTDGIEPNILLAVAEDES
jgi:hypothetical protein